MTPLALAILKERLLPPAKRTLEDGCGILEKIDDIHCFEVSDVVDIARGLARAPELTVREQTDRFVAMADRTTFLPAPKTWIEYIDKGVRVGWLLTESGNRAEVRHAGSGRGRSWSAFPEVCSFGLGAKGGDPEELFVPAGMSDEASHAKMWQIIELQAFLALINTPRVIGRREHEPHRGIERRLRAAHGDDAFKLHGWAEIKLDVNSAEGAPETDGDRMTGQKALHFCRAHLRMKLGRVEIVRAHWRGDAALGIKPARYTVTK